MATDLRDTALNPNMPMRRDQLAQMTATPRSPRLGFLADAMMALKEFANRVQVPAGVPLLGGEGVGSLLLGKAPEELVEMSYGNMPMRINPYAGQTASFVPEMKPGRGAQVADLLSLAPTPGGARAAAGLAGMADMGGMERALIGYHGTPARFAPEEGAPLGRFRSEKIGTGEGAQAYGYGLYFAEAPEVAQGYRIGLSNPRPFLTQELENVLPDTFQGKAPDWADAIASGKTFSDLLATVKLPWQKALLRQNKPQLEKLIADAQSGGSLYTVDIPDEMIGKMLDWDKPLSQQPESVKNAIYGAVQGKYLTGASGERRFIQPPNANMSGGAAYARIVRLLDKGEAEASNLLRKQGIPGIRYLDEGSRGAGDGTRNIVVFPGEEQNVKILSRE